MYEALPRAITRLLLVQLLFNCTQIHVITYTNTKLHSLAALHKWNVQQDTENPSVSHKIALHQLLLKLAYQLLLAISVKVRPQSRIAKDKSKFSAAILLTIGYNCQCNTCPSTTYAIYHQQNSYNIRLQLG